MKKIILPLAAVALLSACSTISDGTTQEIVVNTNPEGANCALMREGVAVARVNPTPGAATIQKTKHDITIVCTKSGFQQATFMNKSGVAANTFGNIILGGGIGWAIDSATGADNKYASPVNVTMIPEGATPAPATGEATGNAAGAATPAAPK
ncbi:MAG: hypothetical protein ACOVN0_19660 [Niveispirillum sp.]|uniref:hypothetical protein n=1 Tax=Niveispirillum sp. TaxID=1917217 RepID=UPI003BA57E95